MTFDGATALTPDERAALVEAVQANCDIADARHAAELTLCTYLLQLREFYRWQQGLAGDAVPAREALGRWIAEREAHWDALDGADYRPLPLRAGLAPFDPFDADGVNAALEGSGLAYGAGLTGAGVAQFFLAERVAIGRRQGVRVLQTGAELARGLLAPPGLLAPGAEGSTIVLRRDALARWCRQRFEAHALRPHDGSAFAAVVAAYGLQQGGGSAWERWLDDEAEALVLHELGEWRAGEVLGPDWAALRLSLPSRRADLHARALRDHLADLAVTLPTLLERDAAPSLHAWFAHYDGVRAALFPALEAAYRAWRGGDGGAALRRACTAGQAHFGRLAERALALHRTRGPEAAGAIEALLTAPETVCPPP